MFWQEEGLFIYQLDEEWWRAAWVADMPGAWMGNSWYYSSTKPIVQMVVPYSSIVNPTGYIYWNGEISWGANAGFFDNILSEASVAVIKRHNRLRGDVNNDGVVNDTDTALSLAAASGFIGLSFQDYLYTAGLNYAAGCVAVPWVAGGQINAYLQNLWVVNPDNPLVQNLHIGELFTDDWGYNQLSPEISGQTITILQNGDNLFAVEGIYPDGTPWSAAILLDGNNLLRFQQDAEEPIVELLNRQPVTFVMPDGVQFRQAISRLTGDYSTAVDDPVIPVTLMSVGCYPNPFAASTTIKFVGNIPTKIEVFNIKGQKIQSLTNNSKTQSIVWDGRNSQGKQVADGVYFIRATAENQMMTTKVIKIH
ncbi:MAG TPA: T9SS type A sorting domain-containing protein [Patescibacteria group bacterium]|nr:T9SS type A sorting domain-containing protein [Patescibacteria group bacterium]HRU90020.1 T9SS type A sorting domain-containing protein [Patescibacteria group bacterium]